MFTAIDTTASPPGSETPAAAHANYWNAKKGILSWLFTIDHKRLGIMYLVSVLTFFLVAGVLALLVRTELMTAKGDIFTGDQYNKLFTLHGAIMVFVVI